MKPGAMMSLAVHHGKLEVPLSAFEAIRLMQLLTSVLQLRSLAFQPPVELGVTSDLEEVNCRTSAALLRKCVAVLSVHAGMLPAVAETMVALCNLGFGRVETWINGTPLVVEPVTVEAICAQYYRARGEAPDDKVVVA